MLGCLNTGIEGGEKESEMCEYVASCRGLGAGVESWAPLAGGLGLGFCRMPRCGQVGEGSEGGLNMERNVDHNHVRGRLFLGGGCQVRKVSTCSHQRH